MNLNINGEEGDTTMMDRFSAIVTLAQNPNDEEARKIVFQDLGEESRVPEPMYTENYQNTYMLGYVPPMKVYSNLPKETYPGDPEPEQEDDDEVYDYGAALSDLINKVKNQSLAEEMAEEEARRTQEDEYLEMKKQREAEAAVSGEQEVETDNPEVDDSGEIESVGDNTGEEEPDEETSAEKEEETESADVAEDEPVEEPVSKESSVAEEATEGAGDSEEPASVVEKQSAENGGNAEEESTGITVNGKPVRIGEEMVLNGK